MDNQATEQQKGEPELPKWKPKDYKEAMQYIDELRSLESFWKAQRDDWRGIAAAMGYEPNAHLEVRPKSKWILERVAHFRSEVAKTEKAEQEKLNQELVEALKFYADGEHWEIEEYLNGVGLINVCVERGRKAREALQRHANLRKEG